jgi:hypothetical protein
MAFSLIILERQIVHEKHQNAKRIHLPCVDDFLADAASAGTAIGVIS